MRVGVVTTQAPFIIGGAERHSANLVTALRERGHEATEISIPYKWYPASAIVDHVLAAKLIDLEGLGYPVDLMVGLKFPAYLARHPNKVFWILHQHRQAYDIWEAGNSELQRDPDGAAVRELIRAEDRAAIGAAERVYANSRNVAARLDRYLGLAAEPLYHPPPNAERLRQGGFGDYLYAPSRLGPTKRQRLMIEALVHAPGARLVIAGPPDAPGEDDALRRLAKDLGVAARCEVLGAVSDPEMIRLYAECRAVVFVPVDEDYGYITLEAMLSGKPVITVTDAGGPLEFVRDGAEGIIAAPEPEALGAAFARLSGDPDAAERMGAAALETYREKRIGWDRVVEVLTGEPLPHAAPAPVAPESLPAPAAPDLAALKSELAPPRPDRLPFADLDALLAAYDFGTYPGDWEAQAPLHRPYFETHWRRYCATLALIEELAPARVLDVGIVPPFLFQGVVAGLCPEAEIEGVWSDPRPFEQTVRATGPGARDFRVQLHPGDVERDPLPLADGAADLVLAMEILEHLAVDPLYFLAEASRVLAPGGHLVVTTPNMASHRQVAKALAGAAPYSFGPFVPVGGAHGRHNREYVVPELRALTAAAGFETVRCLTADCYDDRIDAGTAALLRGRSEEFSLRGETILWLGRKADDPGRAPEGLYHGRPEQLSGRLMLEARGPDGTVTIGATNTSRAGWASEGRFAIGLCLDWEDEAGRFRHQQAQRPLRAGAASGETVRITLALGTDPVGGWLTVGLYERDAGRMAGAGRANTLRIACSEAAFLRLVAK